eukprot:NODE_1082_length_1108_cov_57.801700_g831_i0.p1 GENE.NODE_1082_length_1108_cov_57.801700_g831_i0~~NODE_1082_length_1108_cov_57.801700_g831_i0.p1  ORF type:complete len:301 (+),score=91.42 NODE_1082_length_1108_cov_57.801700_g831_i0:80-982(+)
MAEEIPLKATPSLLYQNLSYGDGKFVYIHKTEAHVLNVKTKETSFLLAKDKISQAKVVDVNGQKLVVLAARGSTQFWDLAKEKIVFQVPLEDEDKDTFLSRGIASSGNQVFVGHSYGAISVIEVNGEAGSVTSTLKEHKEVITDISSGDINGESVIVSADIAGEVVIWDKTRTPTHIEKAAGDTCTCIAVTSNNIVCGYGSGKIRLFNTSGKKVCEIAAHARWLNAIDYCAKTNTLASVAEDMLLQFWKVPTAADPKVALKGHKFLKDSLLSGVKFTDEGNQVACTAYDTEKLFVFDAPQ